ncbi:MAG TPA: hypothetical protein VN408_40335, partial [Actinoplanes sp.]|nr:hypothetical protein [Actinoplanes sp.]
KLTTGAKVTAGVLGAALLGGVLLVPSLFTSDDPATGNRTTLGSTAGTTAAPTEEAAATTPPLDPKSFQFSLDEANRQITAGLAALTKATTPAATAKAASALAQTVGTQTSTLSGLTAPAEATTAYQDVVSALSALEEELNSVSGSATSQDVCTGGAANAVLSRADAAADLRTAISGLAAADPAAKYKFGSFLPAVTKDQNRRKANATYLKRVTGGSGELKVDNGNAGDVVIKLVKSGSKKPSVTVYIRGKKKVTTGRIKDGTYQVFVSSGTDWDGKRFTRNCGFTKFDSSFKFTTTSRQYTIWQLSLKTVLGGNATSTPVNPEAFPE